MKQVINGVYSVSIYLIIFIIAVSTLLLNYLLYCASNVLQKIGMKATEDKLKRAGIISASFAMSQGMVIDRKTNKLVSIQKPSLSWYQRLLR